MTSKTLPAVARQRVRTTIGASALGLALLAVAAAPASAAPSLTAGVADGTLRISGGPLPERITLRLNALNPNQLQVDDGDDGSADFTADLRTFDAIDVEGGNGNDSIRIDQANGIFTTTKPTRIDGQNGDDTLIGGTGAEVFVGGRGDDFVDGNGGADTAFLGKGDDTFVWDPGDASDVVEGGSGTDTMVFNGSAGDEIMAATAVGDRVRFTRNLGTIVMDLDDVEVVDVRSLGGADTVTVNDLTGTDLDRVDVDLAGTLGGSTGDATADVVRVAATNGDDSIVVDADGSAVDVSGLPATVRITHADPAMDKLVIDGVAGGDDVALDPALGALILVAVN